ncbi:MAG TPA: sugar phosphate isomerase/epimerase [Bryobacteraceae bacterium]|nr:sugar phosphate isomerase/epimerase [Bryobacteraceae bacterium]
MYSRRDFSKLALAGIPAAALWAKPNSKINGVQIGCQSYSFRDRSLDEALKAMVDIGLSECELWQGHVEPKKGTPPEDVKKWRVAPRTLTELRDVKKKFDAAGVNIYALNYSFNKAFSDEEIEHGMEFAKALGTKYITASSKVSLAKKINDIAHKHGVIVAMHGHDKTSDPDEFSSSDSFARAMDGNSNIAVNLDIGHFTAANEDPLAYIDKHHDKIVTLHIKDRKKNHGDNMPFGQGETKIKEVLQLLKNKKYRIPANIEYEYKGVDTVAEVKKCYEFCKAALA